MLKTMKQFREEDMGYTCDGNLIAEKYAEYFRDNAEVGDGATVCLWTDSKAYTIIKRSAKSLTLRRCKAVLDPEFKPEWIPGGFGAHCTNNDEQRYFYEEDPDGEVIKAFWSEAKKGFYCHGLHVIAGRHEFYDYNF